MADIGRCLYKSEDTKDFTIVCRGGGSVLAHTAVLQVCSRIFKSIINGTGPGDPGWKSMSTQDSKVGWAVVCEIMYTGSTEAEPPLESIMDALVISHFYGIMRCYMVCKSRLSALLNASNALEILACAHKARDDGLMTRCCELICNGYKDFICDKHWIEKYLNLILLTPAAELVCSVMQCVLYQNPSLHGPDLDTGYMFERLEAAHDFSEYGAIKTNILECTWLLTDDQFMQEYHRFITDHPEFLRYLCL